MGCLELRNLRVNRRLSEETPCYSADLYVDGRLTARVGNRGHGGSDEWYDVHRPNDHEAYRLLNERVGREYPPLDMSAYGMEPLRADIVLVCHRLVEESMLREDMAKLMRRAVAFFKDGLPPEGTKAALYSTKLRPGDTEESLKQYLLRQYPCAYFLNGLPPADQLQAYLRAA